MNRRRTTLVSLAVILAFGLAACGKRGAPIPPEGTTYPRQYPAPRYVLPDGAEAPEAGTSKANDKSPTIFPYDRKTTKTYGSGYTE